jgi:hypothetical protein
VAIVILLHGVALRVSVRRSHKNNYGLKLEYVFLQRNMLKTLWATVRQGKIELLDSAELPEGVRVLVTLLPDDEPEFWLKASQTSLNAVWDNTEDEVYAELL